jgi:hypothetical protein
MNADERKALAETLAQSKDEKVIREIVRFAESFLTAQLQSGLAADLRALTLAAVLAAVIGGMLAATATVLAAADIKLGLHTISIGLFCACLVVALFSAMHAARPTLFDYAGNNPKFYKEDVEQNKPFIQVMAEQASFYAQGIERNNKVADENHRCIRRALTWVFIATVIGLGSEFVIFLMKLGAPKSANVPLPVAGEIDALAALHGQAGETVHLIAIRHAAVVFTP